MMRKIQFLFLLMALMLVPVASSCEEIEKEDSCEVSETKWDNVIDALIQVESGGRLNAKRGSSVGVLQITPILVAECNNIMRRNNDRRRFTLNDRYSYEKSKEMFILLQDHFNKSGNVEKAVKSWNLGFYNRGYRDKGRKYYQKFLRYYKD